jgi:hypothetical protein
VGAEARFRFGATQGSIGRGRSAVPVRKQMCGGVKDKGTQPLWHPIQFLILSCRLVALVIAQVIAQVNVPRHGSPPRFPGLMRLSLVQTGPLPIPSHQSWQIAGNPTCSLQQQTALFFWQSARSSDEAPPSFTEVEVSTLPVGLRARQKQWWLRGVLIVSSVRTSGVVRAREGVFCIAAALPEG